MAYFLLGRWFQQPVAFEEIDSAIPTNSRSSIGAEAGQMSEKRTNRREPRGEIFARTVKAPATDERSSSSGEQRKTRRCVLLREQAFC